MLKISIRAYRLAERRAARRGLVLRATDAYFDRRRRRLIVTLDSGALAATQTAPALAGSKCTALACRLTQ